jgi:hypothetical protein
MKFFERKAFEAAKGLQKEQHQTREALDRLKAAQKEEEGTVKWLEQVSPFIHERDSSARKLNRLAAELTLAQAESKNEIAEEKQNQLAEELKNFDAINARIEETEESIGFKMSDKYSVRDIDIEQLRSLV